ncbi:MAG: MFS transporter [Planctomycetes bacterium]|nr:MFS transporter [Planctomycetota bacterium]
MNPWAGLAGLSRALWLLALATLVNRAGTMVMPFLTIYLVQERGLSTSAAGGMVGVYGLVTLVVAPLAGRISDRVGAPGVMGFSLFGSAVAFAVFPLATGFVGLVAATVFLAVCNEPFRPASMACITDLTTPPQRRAAFALQRLAINLGLSVGPLAGGFLSEAGFWLLFAVNAAAAGLAGLVVALARLPRAAAPVAAAGADPETSPLGDRRFLLFLVAVVGVGIVFFQHASTMPLYLRDELRVGGRVFGAMITVNTLLIVFTEVWLVQRLAAVSTRWLLAVGSVLTGLGFGSLGWVDSIAGVTATVVVWTVGEMILFPTMVAYVAELAPPGRNGAYMGLYSMSFGLAFSLGPALGSVILDHLGSAVLWWGCLGLGLGAGLLFARPPR